MRIVEPSLLISKSAKLAPEQEANVGAEKIHRGAGSAPLLKVPCEQRENRDRWNWQESRWRAQNLRGSTERIRAYAEFAYFNRKAYADSAYSTGSKQAASLVGMLRATKNHCN